MILSTFRRLVRYRLYFFLFFLISNTACMIRMQSIPVEIVAGAAVPDVVVIGGYTPQQALDWYDDLGPKGRSIYIRWSIIDILFVIPSYVLMMGTQLVLVTTECPEILCYMPVLAATFDGIESLTHLAAVVWYGVWSPSIHHLVVASAATQFKFAGIGSSLILVAIYSTIASWMLRGRREAKSVKES
jgi:hypothetical protein